MSACVFFLIQKKEKIIKDYMHDSEMNKSTYLTRSNIVSYKTN